MGIFLRPISAIRAMDEDWIHDALDHNRGRDDAPLGGPVEMVGPEIAWGQSSLSLGTGQPS